MYERQLKGLIYNCDDKYFPGHKCKEKNLFMAMSKDVSKEEEYVSRLPKIPPPDDLNHPSDPHEFEPLISMNALIGFFSPQTLKLIGYIKD
jgi:hypothetical protein